MSRILRVGIVQMPVTNKREVNIAYLKNAIEEMMQQFIRPEIVISGELNLAFDPEPIPGPISDEFCELARKYKAYLIPGTYPEKAPQLKEGECYNSAPIINPDGEIVDVYRKMFPYYPAEPSTKPGDRYVVFDMPEKNTKIGVQICWDIDFPEVSRAETLMGAEVLIKLSMDMLPFRESECHFPVVRAVENQAYFISVNDVGNIMGFTMYGHSMIVDPSGKILFEADGNPNICVYPIDLDVVSTSREYGTLLMNQTLKHLAMINPPQPYANRIQEAPLFKTLSGPRNTAGEFLEKIREIGVGKSA